MSWPRFFQNQEVRARVCASLIGALLLGSIGAGCANENNDFFESGGPREVGTTSLAITSVSRWSDVEGDLQPSFQLNPERALAEVMPTALYSSESQTTEDMLGFVGHESFGPVVPPWARRRAVASTAPAATQPSSQTSDSSSRSRNGSNSGKGGSAGAVVISDKPIDIDPQLKYSLAASLYQYVGLTNHYVRDMVNSEGANAYVIRLQVCLMPLSRQAQYDAYVDVSFFAENPGAGTTRPADIQLSADSIQIVPLLSTDSLEGLMRSNSSSDTKEIALSLQAMFATAGAGIDASHLSQVLKAVTGQDINSLLTIGRVNDNTVRVRLGAFAQPTGEFAMVPRTCMVPVVLLIKDRSAQHVPARVRAVSKTVFVNALTGKLLRARTHFDQVMQLESIRESYWLFQPPYHFSPAEIWELTGWAESGDFAPFRQKVRGQNPAVSPDEMGRLWLEAVSLRATDPLASMEFDLPRTAAPHAPPADQTATLYDDGAMATATLFGGQSLADMRLQGVLEFPLATASGNSGNSPPLRLYSESPEVYPDGSTVVLKFPSLSATGVLEKAGTSPDNVTLMLMVDPQDANDGTSAIMTRYHVLNVAKPLELPPPPAPATRPSEFAGFPDRATITVQKIDTINGVADLQLQAIPAESYLTVDGATLSDATGSPLEIVEFDRNKHRAIFHKAGTVHLQFVDSNAKTMLHVFDSQSQVIWSYAFSSSSSNPARQNGGQGGKGGQGGNPVSN